MVGTVATYSCFGRNPVGVMKKDGATAGVYLGEVDVARRTRNSLSNVAGTRDAIG